MGGASGSEGAHPRGGHAVHGTKQGKERPPELERKGPATEQPLQREGIHDPARTSTNRQERELVQAVAGDPYQPRVPLNLAPPGCEDSLAGHPLLGVSGKTYLRIAALCGREGGKVATWRAGAVLLPPLPSQELHPIKVIYHHPPGGRGAVIPETLLLEQGARGTKQANMSFLGNIHSHMVPHTKPRKAGPHRLLGPKGGGVEAIGEFTERLGAAKLASFPGGPDGGAKCSLAAHSEGMVKMAKIG
jgi:hypothetical protein